MKSWCIPEAGAPFVAAMEDVLDVYAQPYDPRRPQVCIDETSKELHDTPKGTLPPQPGQPARQDYKYDRHGVANIFIAVEPLRGYRRIRVTEHRKAQDLAEFLHFLVDEVYPEAETLVLVADNLNIHSSACLYKRFEPEEAQRIARKLEWHYTPKHGSWLNIAECELSVLSRQCLRRRIPDLPSLQREAQALENERNTAQTKVVWRFTTADARIKLKRLYPVLKEQNLS